MYSKAVRQYSGQVEAIAKSLIYPPCFRFPLAPLSRLIIFPQSAGHISFILGMFFLQSEAVFFLLISWPYFLYLGRMCSLSQLDIYPLTEAYFFPCQLDIFPSCWNYFFPQSVGHISFILVIFCSMVSWRYFLFSNLSFNYFLHTGPYLPVPLAIFFEQSENNIFDKLL